MIRKVTKQSTVTPMRTAKGSVLSKIGKGKGNGKGKSVKETMPRIERISTEVKPPAKSSENKKATAGASKMSGWKSSTEIKLEKMLKDVNKGPGVPSFTSGTINSSAKKKPKAKMLPEVKVTAKKKIK